MKDQRSDGSGLVVAAEVVEKIIGDEEDQDHARDPGRDTRRAGREIEEDTEAVIERVNGDEDAGDTSALTVAPTNPEDDDEEVMILTVILTLNQRRVKLGLKLLIRELRGSCSQLLIR